jgi:hypothetical protein
MKDIVPNSSPDKKSHKPSPSEANSDIPLMPHEEEMMRRRQEVDELFSQPRPESPKVDANPAISEVAAPNTAEGRIGPRNPAHPLVKKEPGGRNPSDS